MNKKSVISIVILAGIIIVVSVFFVFFKKDNVSAEQLVFQNVNSISREYIALRYRTDMILVDAEKYPDYQTWNKEIEILINDWKKLDEAALDLEKSANVMSEEKVSFNLINKVLAYEKQELSDIFDRAPAGKKIATLAKYLGVDAKLAYKILKQDQDQVTADIWNEEGDIYRTLEVGATVVKDGCKIAGFVGGVAVTGGTAAVAAGSSLSQAAIVVGGADLILEVADDGASIALGDENKISSISRIARTVTEPLATILAINEVPNNLKTGFQKFQSVMLGVDQLKGAAQDGKIVGIALPVYQPNKKSVPIKSAVLDGDELDQWFDDNNLANKVLTRVDLDKILLEEPFLKETAENTENNIETTGIEKSVDSHIEKNTVGSVVGVWTGVLKEITKSDSEEAEERPVTFTFSANGDVETNYDYEEDYIWTQEGEQVKFIEKNNSDGGYWEFLLDGDELTFIKAAGSNSEGSWGEIYAGSDFLGGKFIEIHLKRQ